jgi:amicoumacin kinase
MQKDFYYQLLNIVETLYDANSGRLESLSGGFQNIVFKYHADSSEQILRVTSRSKRTIESIQSELDFIGCLAKAGVAVSKPIPSKNGCYIEEFYYQGDSYYLTSFEQAIGKPIDVSNPDEWNREFFKNWGRTLGQMHNVAQKHNHQFEFYKRPSWSGLNGDISTFLATNSKKALITYEKLMKTINSLPREKDTYGLIHNDFHQGNFFVLEGQLTIFDFDDTSFCWFAQDIAASFYHAVWQGLAFNPEYKNFPLEFIYSFLEGYRLEINLSKEILKQIPLFLKLREFFLYTLFHQKWDLQNLLDWQAYTLEDLTYRIENEIPYTDIDFEMLIKKSPC